MNTDLLSRFEALKKEQDRLTKLKYQKEAELNQVTNLLNETVNSLKEEYKVSSMKEARQLLNNLTNELNELTEELDKELAQFESDSYEL